MPSSRRTSPAQRTQRSTRQHPVHPFADPHEMHPQYPKKHSRLSAQYSMPDKIAGGGIRASRPTACANWIPCLMCNNTHCMPCAYKTADTESLRASAQRQIRCRLSCHSNNAIKQNPQKRFAPTRRAGCSHPTAPHRNSAQKINASTVPTCRHPVTCRSAVQKANMPLYPDAF